MTRPAPSVRCGLAATRWRRASATSRHDPNVAAPGGGANSAAERCEPAGRSVRFGGDPICQVGIAGRRAGRKPDRRAPSPAPFPLPAASTIVREKPTAPGAAHSSGPASSSRGAFLGVRCEQRGRDVRFHRDRGGFGRLSGRGAAQRKRQVSGAAARSRRRDRNPWIHIPLGYTKTFTDPRVNWMFESEPEAQLNGRMLYQPRGKVLGGTSSINGMVYMRGTPPITTIGASAAARAGTTTACCRSSRRPRTRSAAPTSSTAPAGRCGSSNPVHSPLGDAMVQAAIEAGVPANPDFNGARQEGVGYYQTTTGNRARWSAAKAYLKPARTGRISRSSPNAHATRVLIEDGRAVGVEYRTPDGLFTARAPRRDHRVRRRLRLAAIAAAVGAGSGRSSDAARHRGGARHAGGRRRTCTTISTPISSGAAPSRSRSTIWR